MPTSIAGQAVLLSVGTGQRELGRLITDRQRTGGSDGRGRGALFDTRGGGLAARACQARADDACDHTQSETGPHVEENSTW